VAAILMVVYSLGFAMASVPWWLLVGLVCGAFQLIPVAGPAAALLLVSAVAWFGTGKLSVLGGAAATFVVAQALESFFLTPRILGTRLKLSPFFVFTAVLFGGILLGPFGVIFAVPLVAVGMVLWRRYGRRAQPVAGDRTPSS
jgi:predicted PurR-regulated permease PerM